MFVKNLPTQIHGKTDCDTSLFLISETKYTVMFISYTSETKMLPFDEYYKDTRSQTKILKSQNLCHFFKKNFFFKLSFSSKSKSTALQAQYLPQGELSALTNHV